MNAAINVHIFPPDTKLVIIYYPELNEDRILLYICLSGNKIICVEFLNTTTPEDLRQCIKIRVGSSIFESTQVQVLYNCT